MNNFIVRFSNGKYMNWTGGDTSYLEEAMMYDTKDEASRWGAEKAKGRGVKVLKLDVDLDKGDYKMTEANPRGSFKALRRKLKRRGAWIGRKKYGKKRFSKMSTAGRRRKRRNPKKSAHAGAKKALQWVAGALGFILLDRVVKSYLKDHKELKA